MQADIAQKRVRQGALILMVLISAELIYYTWNSFRRAYRFSFGEPDRWNTHWRVDEGSVIEFGARFGYFAFWAFVILASIAAFLAGLHLLNLCRRGQIFTPVAADSIRRLGGILAFAMVIDQIFQSMDAYLITRFNAAGAEPIAWFYDPSDIKTFIMAVILLLFGYVMRLGIQVDVENRGYV